MDNSEYMVIYNVSNCCRQKKMERISQLDSEVSQLKEENMNLVQVKEMLKEEARKLKVKLKLHAESGCGAVGEAGAWDGRRPDSTC